MKHKNDKKLTKARLNRGLFAVTAVATMVATSAASAEGLPKQVAWTAYGTGSAGYNQAVAFGAALKNKKGVTLRVLPGKNDIARTEPLRQGKVQFSATGVGGSYMAQEGVFQFGAKNWGPLAVRYLMANTGAGIGLSMGVAADVCESVGKPKCEGFEYSDLKGKRIAHVRGAPALNVNNEAYLAYAGLTWDDVEIVEFGGYSASWQGLVNGEVDGVFAATNSGRTYEAASGPRGLFWPPIDPDNKEALDRMAAVAPFFAPVTATVGANIDDVEGGVKTAAYAYPVLTAMADQDVELVYAMTKEMDELFPDYKDKAPGINGWAKEMQNFQWIVPFHDGAIKYWKEIGLWTDEAQKHNDGLVARQAVLAKAWEELKAENPEDWEAGWIAKRREALKAGGYSVVF